VECEWDEAKRRSNLAKHGVDFAAAQYLAWDSAVETVDARRDYDEVRWRALGMIGTRLHTLALYQTQWSNADHQPAEGEQQGDGRI